MELAVAHRIGQSGRLTLAGISHVYTISHVAEMLGEDEEWLEDVSSEMDPEDGRLFIVGLGEDGVTAFTPFGVETLTELVAMHKVDPTLLRR
jgi:hypothetical protein